MDYKNISFEEGLSLIFNEWTKDVRCIVICKIDSYDKDTRKAVVTPLINKTLGNGEVVQHRPIKDVPCCFIGGNNLNIDVEYQQGDNVLCAVSDYSLHKYEVSDGKNYMDSIDGSHELQDLIVLMGIAPENKKISTTKIEAYGDGIKIKNENGFINLVNNGQVNVNDNLTIDV